MKKAKIPKNECQRLENLLSYNILDTPPESDFDELTRFIAEICDVPYAIISLLDDKRQWFKSRVGISVAETSKEISFCSHAILQDDFFQVTNALDDERFFDNPLVTDGPKIMFYAAFPLISDEGFRLGTFCVLDRQPRKLNSFQINSLKVVSHQVMSQIELRKTNQSLKKMYKAVKDTNDHVMSRERMATLGEMAAGLAHEINNPLGVISLLSAEIRQLVAKNEVDKNQINTACEKVEDLVLRIGKIIKSFKTVARKPDLDPLSKDNLMNILEDTLSISSDKIKNQGVKIHLEGDFDKSVMCRSGELVQVFLNLLFNALDANEGLKDSWVKFSVSDQPEFIVLSVTDSGLGIDIKEVSEIMNPFYTTKPIGKGLGLGLGISKKIVEQHKGRLQLDLKSKNTKFDVFLPKINISQGEKNVETSRPHC